MYPVKEIVSLDESSTEAGSDAVLGQSHDGDDASKVVK